MISFYWPYAGILIFLPLLRVFLRQQMLKSEPAEIRFPRTKLITELRLNKFTNVSREKIIPILWWLVWALLVFALMRPEIIANPQKAEAKGKDILLAIDLSRSMHALDFATGSNRLSRLAVVKDVVKKFIQQREGDRIGVIAFAQEAYNYVPLSFDLATVSYLLNGLEVGMAGEATAIADAIVLATKQLSNRSGDKILILLTDGDDTASHIPPLQAASLAKKYGIKIYTIGIGSSGEVAVVTKDQQVVAMQSNINDKLLYEIATTTGGSYSFATDKHGLQEIYNKINALESIKIETNFVLLSKPIYQYPMGLALVLMLVIICLNMRTTITYAVRT